MCSMASQSLFTTDQVCLHPLLSLELSTSPPSRRSFGGVLGMSARLRTRRLAMYHNFTPPPPPPSSSTPSTSTTTTPLPPRPKGRVDNSLYRCAFWCWEKCSTAGITDPSDCVFGADSDTHCYCGSGFNATAAYGHNSVPKKQQKTKKKDLRRGCWGALLSRPLDGDGALPAISIFSRWCTLLVQMCADVRNNSDGRRASKVPRPSLQVQPAVPGERVGSVRWPVLGARFFNPVPHWHRSRSIAITIAAVASAAARTSFAITAPCPANAPWTAWTAVTGSIPMSITAAAGAGIVLRHNAFDRATRQSCCG